VVKRILLPLDPSPYTESVIRVATMIGKMYDAQITGLVVLDIPGIERSIGPIPVGALHYAEKMELAKKVEASQRIEGLIDKFVTKCENEGVACHEAHTQGYPSDQIINESKYYDLMIIGLRTFFHFETSDMTGDSLDAILSEAVAPILGIPSDFDYDIKSGRKLKVLIAFNGGVQSARALQRFAQLVNPDYMDITIMNSSDNKKEGIYLLDRAAEYLHSRNIREVKKEWTSQDVKKIVKDKYYDTHDVFVVGAHAREGLFDFMVGSLTKYLLREAKKPVFIGQ